MELKLVTVFETVMEKEIQLACIQLENSFVSGHHKVRT